MMHTFIFAFENGMNILTGGMHASVSALERVKSTSQITIIKLFKLVMQHFFSLLFSDWIASLIHSFLFYFIAIQVKSLLKACIFSVRIHTSASEMIEWFWSTFQILTCGTMILHYISTTVSFRTRIRALPQSYQKLHINQAHESYVDGINVTGSSSSFFNFLTWKILKLLRAWQR